MKSTYLFVLVLLVLMTSPMSVALAGEGDPQPGVEFNPYNVGCGIPAGEYGFFSTRDWWWASYSNGGAVLKCVARLHPDQTPPDGQIIVEKGFLCATPAGLTSDSFTKVDEDGNVALICRIRLPDSD